MLPAFDAEQWSRPQEDIKDRSTVTNGQQKHTEAHKMPTASFEAYCKKASFEAYCKNQYNAFCGRRTSERDSEPCTCEIAPGYLQ